MSLVAPLRSALRPALAPHRRAVLPSQAQHSRAFSLWPSSQPLTTPTPESTTPTPPILLHAAPPTTLDPTYFEPLSNLLLSLPPALGLTYAAFIPLATVLLRTTTTLPITLWQRGRTRRLVDEVMPLVREGQRSLSLTTRDECRRQGKTFEEYQEVFKKRAKSLASSLAWKHSATPLLTLLVPPMLHVPIFILTTLTLRDACTRALTFVGSTLPSDTTALSNLLDLSATPLLWCDSMILPDPTMGLPLLVGLAAMLNVEVSARNRRVAATGVEEGPKDPSEGKGRAMTAADRRRIEAQRARTRGGVGTGIKVAVPREVERQSRPTGARQLATTATPPAPAAPSPDTAVRLPSPADGPPPLEAEEGRTPRIVTNVLRISAVMFIPIAAMAPSAVCAYWLTSNLYTLIQNLAFAAADRGRLRRKRVQQIVDRLD